MDSGARAELQRLMTRLADGDRSVFSSVYKALWPLLRAFVARQLPPNDSEDVAQEALLKVFAHASDFDSDREALSWVLGIVAFEVRTVRKRLVRRRELLLEQPPAQACPDSLEEAVVLRDLEAAALQVLGTLRPSDTETLRLVASGRSLSIPGPTFRKRVERALKRWKLAWRAKHGVD